MLKNYKLLFITFFLSIVIRIESTEFSYCKNVRLENKLSIKAINITDCDEPPCKLKKGTTIHLEQVFVPSNDVGKLVTSVHATIAKIPLPFIGVDGFNACNDIYNLDYTKTQCPLKAGDQYIYKNEFPILYIYPSVSLVVYWALVENGNIVTCFEVPAIITN